MTAHSPKADPECGFLHGSPPPHTYQKDKCLGFHRPAHSRPLVTEAKATLRAGRRSPLSGWKLLRLTSHEPSAAPATEQRKKTITLPHISTHDDTWTQEPGLRCPLHTSLRDALGHVPRRKTQGTQGLCTGRQQVSSNLHSAALGQ